MTRNITNLINLSRRLLCLNYLTSLDIEKCKTFQEIERVELNLFNMNKTMYNLLRYMCYLVDFMRENNIVWGVGRGSSVSSYVLFLIGIHKVNSIQYDLDYKEFLR